MSKVYRDIFSKDQLLVDGFYRTEIYDGLIYQVKRKLTGRSADAADDTFGELDLVTRFGLIPIVISIEEFRTWTKAFGRQMLIYLTENKSDRAGTFKRSYQDFQKDLISKFDTFGFYTGNSMNQNGSIIISSYEDESNTVPILWFFKDALEVVPEEEEL